VQSKKQRKENDDKQVSLASQARTDVNKRRIMLIRLLLMPVLLSIESTSFQGTK